MRKLDYKWIIFAMCFLMVFICLGFCSNGSIYLSAITDALNIKRSLFSLRDSFRFVASAVVSVFFGAFIFKYGVRKMVAFGVVFLIAAMLCFATANNIIVFCIGGALLGIGLSFTTNTMASSIIRRWFKKDIGRYTGIVFSANGIGAAVVTQIASPMINREGDPFGYRDAYFLIALVLVIAGIVVVSLLRERPKVDFAPVISQKSDENRKLFWEGVPYQVAKKYSYFYLAAVIVFITGFVLQGINCVYVAHLQDIGMDASFVALIVSIFSLMLTLSKILVGVMYDKFGLRIIMIVCQVGAAISFFLLPLAQATTLGKVISVAFVLLYAMSLPLETLVVPLIVNDLFGTVSYDKFLGLFVAINYAGYAIGSPIINLCYDFFGSYNAVFVICGVLMLVGCLVFQYVICEAESNKQKLIANKQKTDVS